MSDLLYEYKMRLKLNHSACRNAYQRFKKAIAEEDDTEIYASIGELLLWVMTTDQWHKDHGKQDYRKRRNADVDGVLLKGMTHAFNLLKHNMEFMKIHRREGGISFPISFPLSIPPTSIRWVPAGNGLHGLYPNQRENYIEHLQGKELLETFESVLRFLYEENSKFYFN